MNTLASHLCSEFEAILVESRRRGVDVERIERLCKELEQAKALDPGDVHLHRLDLLDILVETRDKHPRLIVLSVGCIQKLVAHHIISDNDASVDKLLEFLESVLEINAEIQLRILQVLLPLVSGYRSVTDNRLECVFGICIQLVGSRSSTIHNSASVILRQLVVFVFDRMEKWNSEKPIYHADALHVFQDLCRVINREQTIVLGDTGVEFALELIESIISTHSDAFRTFDDLKTLFRESLCTFVTKMSRENPGYTLFVRLLRLSGLIIQRFCSVMDVEAEVLLSTFVWIVEHDHAWKKTLTLETIRGVVCNLDSLAHLHRHDQVSRTNIVQELFVALHKVILTSKQMELLSVDESSARTLWTRVHDKNYDSDILNLTIVFQCLTSTVEALFESRNDKRDMVVDLLTNWDGIQILVMEFYEIDMDMGTFRILVDSMAQLLYMAASLSMEDKRDIFLAHWTKLLILKIDLALADVAGKIELDKETLISITTLFNTVFVISHLMDSAWTWILELLRVIKWYRTVRGEELVHGNCWEEMVTATDRMLLDKHILSMESFHEIVKSFDNTMRPLFHKTTTERAGKQTILWAGIYGEFLQNNLDKIVVEDLDSLPSSRQVFVDTFLNSIFDHPVLQVGILDLLSRFLIGYCMCFESKILKSTTEIQLHVLSPISKLLHYVIESRADEQIRLGVVELFRSVLTNWIDGLTSGWATVFEILNAAGSTPNDSSDPLHGLLFPCVQLISTDGLVSMGPLELYQCISTLGFYSRGIELNQSLTCIELLWNVSDEIQKQNIQGNGEITGLRIHLLTELLSLTRDSREEVRNASVQTLLRTLALHGKYLSTIEWDRVVCEILVPLFDSVSTLANDESSCENQFIILVMNGTTECLGQFLAANVPAKNLLEKYLDTMRDCCIKGHHKTRSTAIRSLMALAEQAQTQSPWLRSRCRQAWEQICLSIPAFVSETSLEINQQHLGEPSHPYEQELLSGLVGLHKTIGQASDKIQANRTLYCLLRIITAVPSSKELCIDHDGPTTLQLTVNQAFQDLGTESGIFERVIVFECMILRSLFDRSITKESPCQGPAVGLVGLGSHVLTTLPERFSQLDLSDKGFATAFSFFLDTLHLPLDLKYRLVYNGKGDFWRRVLASMIRVFRKVLVSSRIKGLFWTQIVSTLEHAFKYSIYENIDTQRLTHDDLKQDEQLFIELMHLLNEQILDSYVHQDHSDANQRLWDLISRVGRESFLELRSVAKTPTFGTESSIALYYVRESLGRLCWKVMVSNLRNRPQCIPHLFPKLHQRCLSLLKTYAAHIETFPMFPFPRIRIEELILALENLPIVYSVPNTDKDCRFEIMSMLNQCLQTNEIHMKRHLCDALGKIGRQDGFQ